MHGDVITVCVTAFLISLVWSSTKPKATDKTDDKK